MDKRKRFDWLPEEMPGVVKLVAEKRKLHGNAHVNECWRRGVLLLEPGWFFAREGPLTIGVLDPTWQMPELAKLPAAVAGQAMLIMANPEPANGTN